MELTEAQHAELARQVEHFFPRDLAWGASVAFLAERGDTYHVHGSGTLFRIADESFIITAAHVILQKGTNNLLFLPAGTNEPLPCSGEALVSEQDHIDVATFQIPPQIAERLDASRYLRFDSVCLSRHTEGAPFAVLGFPQIMCTQKNGKLNITRFFQFTPMYDGPVANHDRDTHLLLHADLDEARTQEGKAVDFCYEGGVSAPFPRELRGISGGSVWRIFKHPSELHTSTTARANPKLVGVENAVCHDRRYIKATWWTAVVNMFWVLRPDLRDALSMYRG